MRKLVFLAAAAVSPCATNAIAQIPRGVLPPAGRVAIGTVTTQPFVPTTIEATTDGWVVITPMPPKTPSALLGTLAPTSARLVFTPSEVERFVDFARERLGDYDSTRVDSLSHGVPRTFAVGDGTNRLEMRLTTLKQYTSISRTGYNVAHVGFNTIGCAAATLYDGTSRDIAVEFVGLLDSAARHARRLRSTPKSPTLNRAYSSGELSCAPQSAGAIDQRVVRGVAIGSEVAAEFVVDTSGFAEPKSIRMMRSATPRQAKAARVNILGRHYTPGEIDGTPVRALVQSSVVFGPDLPLAPLPVYHPEPTYFYSYANARLVVRPDSSGWIEFNAIFLNSGAQLHEWFTPDSVDAAVKYARRQIDSARANQSDTTRMMQASTPALLGKIAGGVHFMVGPYGRGKGFDVHASMNGCDESLRAEMSTVSDSMINEIARASAKARALRSVPRAVAAGPYSAKNVACPAQVVLKSNSSSRFARIQQYPGAPFPTSYQSRGQFDVLLSVVVDSAGVVNPRTFEFLPGTPAWITKAAMTGVRAMRFKPATRSGRPVSQRIIQVIRFEPPPECVDVSENPACPRRYSDR